MAKAKTKIKALFLLVLALIFIVFFYEGTVKMLHPLKYKEQVFKYAKQYELDPYLVFSVIKAESSFNPKATSHQNARGLMQIIDTTGEWAADQMKIKDFKVESLYDPETNIRIGCWYLSSLVRKYQEKNSESSENITLILAAYNSGPGTVERWLGNKEYSRTGYSLDKIPYKETDAYVKKVSNYYSVYKRIYE